MGNKLKNSLIAALCGISLTSGVREERAEPLLDYSPFKNRLEFLDTINYYNLGIVKEGEWKGLELRKSGEKRLESILDLIESDNKNIRETLDSIKKIVPNFESLDKLNRAKEIYEYLGGEFRYKKNPFDKLQFIDPSIFNYESKKEEYHNISKNIIGLQTINDTYRYRKGDCDALAPLLASNFLNSGIESKLVLIQLTNPLEGEKNQAHIVVLFNNGLIDEKGIESANLLDPSFFGEKNFIENLVYSGGYMNSNNYRLYSLEK